MLDKNADAEKLVKVELTPTPEIIDTNIERSISNIINVNSELGVKQ